MRTSELDISDTPGGFDVKEQEDWDDEEPAPNPLPPIEVKNVWNKQW